MSILTSNLKLAIQTIYLSNLVKTNEKWLSALFIRIIFLPIYENENIRITNEILRNIKLFILEFVQSSYKGPTYSK